MASLDDFFPFVQPDLTSCPNPLVRTALRKALSEFCERSQAWALRLPPVNLVLGQAAYSLTLPEGAQLVEILNLWGDSRELKGKSFNEITQLIPNWQTMVGSPQFFLSDNIVDNVEVYPLPDAGAAGKALLARVALKPTLTTLTVPDFLLNRFYDAIAYGTLSRLMLMPNQPWTDMALGSANESRFRTACEDARIEQLHGRVVGSMVVTSRPFGRP